MAKTKADLIRAEALRLRGEAYQWGEVPDHDSDPDDRDCSGQFYGLVHGIGGYAIGRLTANGYYHHPGVKRLAQPSMVGDFGVMLTPGTDRAHHIVTFIGDPDGPGPKPPQESEARGEAYGQRIYTVAEANARGAVWCRLPGADFGALTLPSSEPDGYILVAWVPRSRREKIHQELRAEKVAHVLVGADHDRYNATVARAKKA